jgi:hypothetical protein
MVNGPDDVRHVCRMASRHALDDLRPVVGRRRGLLAVSTSRSSATRARSVWIDCGSLSHRRNSAVPTWSIRAPRRKSFRPFHFPDQSTWLALAPNARFWQLTATILGQSCKAADTQRARTAKPMMIKAPEIASAAPIRSVRVGACPSISQSHTSDAAM